MQKRETLESMADRRPRMLASENRSRSPIEELLSGSKQPTQQELDQALERITEERRKMRKERTQLEHLIAIHNEISSQQKNIPRSGSEEKHHSGSKHNSGSSPRSSEEKKSSSDREELPGSSGDSRPSFRKSPEPGETAWVSIFRLELEHSILDGAWLMRWQFGAETKTTAG